MKNKSINKSVTRKFSKAEQLVKNILNDFKSEDIHRFRTDVKKIRSLLRLSNQKTNRHHQIKIPKRFKKFYKTIGLIRVLQIQQQKIADAAAEEKLNRPETMQNLLTMKTASSMIRAEVIGRKKKFSKFKAGRFAKRVQQQMPKKKIREFILLELESIQELIAHQPTDASLHGIRKLLKDLLYTWPYISKQIAPLLPDRLSTEEDIKTMADLIGKFHDICVAQNMLLANMQSEKIPDAEKDILEKINNRWTIEKKQLREEIISHFKS